MYGNVPVSRIFDAVLKWDLLFGGKLKRVPICARHLRNHRPETTPLKCGWNWRRWRKPWEVARTLPVQKLAELAGVKHRASLENNDAPNNQTSDGKNPPAAASVDPEKAKATRPDDLISSEVAISDYATSKRTLHT